MSQGKPIFCSECGEKNVADSTYCMACGTALSRPSNQNTNQNSQNFQGTRPHPNQFGQQQPNYPRNDEASYKPRYQQPMQYQNQRMSMNTGYQKAPPGAINYICSFCFPLAGLILFFYHRQDHPNEAKNMLIIAVISFVFFTLFNA